MDDDEFDNMMETAEPDQVLIKTIDMNLDWKCRLEEYKAFVR